MNGQGLLSFVHFHLTRCLVPVLSFSQLQAATVLSVATEAVRQNFWILKTGPGTDTTTSGTHNSSFCQKQFYTGS